jgi:hypothetical protein
MAKITISDLHSISLESSELTEINAELAAAINGGLEFTIGKNWKRPIHVKLEVKVG